MDSDLENQVRKCTICQEHQKVHLHGPWKQVHVDYVCIRGNVLSSRWCSFK